MRINARAIGTYYEIHLWTDGVGEEPYWQALPEVDGGITKFTEDRASKLYQVACETHGIEKIRIVRYSSEVVRGVTIT